MPMQRPPVENWLQLPALRLLVGIGEHGSLSAAARNAGMAQSNATRSLKTLERRLGYPLVTRSTRGSTLTREGALTAEWAREVLDAVERLEAGAAALADAGQVKLAVGASMTIAEHLLPGWIGEFRARMPSVETKLRVLNSAQVLDAVLAEEVTLGFVETPEIPAQLQSVTVWTDRMAVVCGTGHPWASRTRPLGLDELAGTGLLEREEGSGTRAFLNQLVGSHRADPLMELNSNAAICQGVVTGLGPAVLSVLAVEGAVRSGRLVEVPVQRQPLERQFKAVWSPANSSSEALREFLDIAVGGRPRG
ncbi:LysR family transcriptional regulator [Arthrobacter sp. Sa2BUA2]|uniref:LysR family transcriptional regulator n=1 Tax=Arthrobacter pullicola TaxID=2762224 RepID=A0ABR8YES8_9MICC|nr:LysR family transcriptional regulator [Arthrobacter pullicola]MBD8042723.1 LysR family transcriptional regulator [Arthrobacter pullicola]